MKLSNIKLFSGGNDRFLKGLKPLVASINALEEEIKAIPDAGLAEETRKLRERLEGGESLDAILPRAFALVREAARRTLGQRHYDVQLLGGIALHQGKIAEMRTGEGKTLVATLPTYLNALAGEGVHVVTVNDYLARRDAVWMGQIYALLGLSVGVINSQNTSFVYDPSHTEADKARDDLGSFKVRYEFLRESSRKEAYAADITYGTNNEYGFDYLRDNLAATLNDVVQRSHAYAIVDEIDSILIDEARTPLIISGETGDSEDFYKTFAVIAGKLKRDGDYTVDEKLKAISLTDPGITKAEELLGISDIYTEKGIKYVHHLETAVRAEALFHKDKDYVVKDGEIVIVDPFTGRLQPGRRWSEGLHQAIEAKENVKIQKETRAIASITFQNYFRFYKKISGMTGTAKTSSEEFYKVYGLDVIPVPTNRPVQRVDHTDLIFQTEKGKWTAIVRKVKELQTKGQPVLIGTVSIERNELLSAYLTQEGVQHTILNAKNHEREGEIVAAAGKKGSVIVATNMAGRGVDIKLGGPEATTEEADAIRALGGLYVLGTERHEARRIDNQLRGRSGRQGDPGETQFFVSLEDDLMRVFGSDRMKNMMGRFGIPEDQPIQNRLISSALESAQAKIEGFNFDARKYTLEYDTVLSHQRSVVYGRRRELLRGDHEHIEALIADIAEGDEAFLKAVADKKAEIGEAAFFETVRRIILYVNDTLWVEHLETMEYTRSSVNLRAYGQREPIVEYKKEGLRLFREMESSFRQQVRSLVPTIHAENAPTQAPTVTPVQNIVATHEELQPFAQEGGNTTSSPVQPTQNTGPKTGRNDPCPCGSGKKYKKCHGVGL